MNTRNITFFCSLPPSPNTNIRESRHVQKLDFGLFRFVPCTLQSPGSCSMKLEPTGYVSGHVTQTLICVWIMKTVINLCFLQRQCIIICFDHTQNLLNQRKWFQPMSPPVSLRWRSRSRESWWLAQVLVYKHIGWILSSIRKGRVLATCWNRRYSFLWWYL